MERLKMPFAAFDFNHVEDVQAGMTDHQLFNQFRQLSFPPANYEI